MGSPLSSPPDLRSNQISGQRNDVEPINIASHLKLLGQLLQILCKYIFKHIFPFINKRKIILSINLMLTLGNALCVMLFVSY